MLLIVAVFVRFFLFSAPQSTVKRVKRHNTTPAVGLQLNAGTTASSPVVEGSSSTVSAAAFLPRPRLFLSASRLDETPAAATERNGTLISQSQRQIHRQGQYNPSAQITRLISSILPYDGNSAPESLDWFNVLLAQIINQYRSDAREKGRLVAWLNAVLNGEKKPDILDDIKITEINIGEDFPIFSNCKIHRREGGQKQQQTSTSTPREPAAGGNTNERNDNNNAEQAFDPTKDPLKGYKDAGDLVAEMDVDLSDTITLGVETRVMLSQPRWLNTVMPTSLTVSIVRFSARMIIRISRASNLDPGEEEEAATGKGTGEKNTKLVLCISFNPDFTLEIAVRSLLGARSRLQDMPRIGHIIENLFLKWFTDHFVDPNHREIVLFRYNTEEMTGEVDTDEVFDDASEGVGGGNEDHVDGGHENGAVDGNDHADEGANQARDDHHRARSPEPEQDQEDAPSGPRLPLQMLLGENATHPNLI